MQDEIVTGINRTALTAEWGMANADEQKEVFVRVPDWFRAELRREWQESTGNAAGKARFQAPSHGWAVLADVEDFIGGLRPYAPQSVAMRDGRGHVFRGLIGRGIDGALFLVG